MSKWVIGNIDVELALSALNLPNGAEDVAEALSMLDLNEIEDIANTSSDMKEQSKLALDAIVEQLCERL